MTTSNKEMINRLVKSEIYQNYEKAFYSSTGLSVSLVPTDSIALDHSNKRKSNPFCALMAKTNSTCSACLMAQAKLCQAANQSTKTITCTAGLNESAVPIKAGNRLIGFLRTGQVFSKAPSESQFNQVVKRLQPNETNIPLGELKKAYFNTPVLPKRRYDSMITMLDIFGQQLASTMNQIVVQEDHHESPAITRAKEFINLNYAEDLSLAQVAQVAHMSSFYFCKNFKKVTGLNFTEFLSRVRIEKAKTLLLNRNLRISEIAFEVGFQTLTHFNRIFKNILGKSPTEYREALVVASLTR
jgi:AraC-like DNA-binding protein/ligand-binding sensor protein